MKQTPVRLGPLALLLTVISICITMLSILSYTSARADLRLAEKYAQTVSDRYELEAEGQRFLAVMQKGTIPDMLAALEDAEDDAEGIIWKSFEKNGARLRIGLKESGGGFRPVCWKHEKDWEENTDIGELWPGPLAPQGGE